MDDASHYTESQLRQQIEAIYGCNWRSVLAAQYEDDFRDERLLVTLHMPWNGDAFDDATVEAGAARMVATKRSAFFSSQRYVAPVDATARRLTGSRCPWCGKWFRNKAAKRLHEREIHGAIVFDSED